MAPRSAKAKKAADVKVTEQDAPKKGRGKGKNVAELKSEVDDDIELDDKSSTENIKVKRGRKGDKDEQNEKGNDAAPPAKRGRKKKADIEPEDASNDEQSAEESIGQAEDSEQNDENVGTNGHIEEAQISNKGRKKQPKKETVTEKPEPKSGRGRKAKQDVEEDNVKKEAAEEKPKSTAKGRGRKPAKETEPDDRSVEDEKEETEKVPKGRKRGAPKATPEKEEEEEEGDNDQEDEEKPDPKKKEPKGKKGKKAVNKDDAEDEEEVETQLSKKRKVAKKEDKAKDEDVPETKPKGKRGQKKVQEASTDTKRKAADEKAPGDTKKQAIAKNKSVTDFEVLDFANSSSNNIGKSWNFKISSWNVDGIRAWLSKGCLDYLKYEKPDILCLQEVKCSQDKLPGEVTNIPGYHGYWLAGDKDGYAGVAIYTTQLAMNVMYGLENEELDTEGRIITAEYEQFYLVCTYVPNSGRKLVTLPKRLQWNKEFRDFVKELDKKKPVIICGDMNVSHKEIDLANPKTNRRNAGFTDEEREGMTELLGEGFIDTFRHLYPDKTGAYTFWTYMSNSRSRNVGWRLDYFIISERLLPALCDNVIRDGVYGSDHCPLSLFLHLSSADKPKE